MIEVLKHSRCWIWVVAAVVSCSIDGSAADQKPNVVFLLVDDLGWADVGCFGSSFYETPQIDRLAAQGMKFTQAYAACPVCSPTRASILTGKHPVRLDLTDWIPGMRADRYPNARFLHVTDRDELALAEVTLAEMLRQHGYQTFFAGKWHLGGPGHWPTDQGFDVNIGGNEKGSPPGGYYAPWNNPTLKARATGEYLTERLTDEAVRFLESRDPSSPFLLYLSYYNVHAPITPYAKRFEQFRRKASADTTSPETLIEHLGRSRTRQNNPAYASMVAAVDDSVGRLLDALAEQQLSERTVVCLFSDNGGLCTTRTSGPTSNLPLRSGKGWLYEGGIRVPAIVRAPGATDAGSTCNEPIVSMDFLPTLLDLAGVERAQLEPLDGVSLLPLLRGEGNLRERALVWHYPHYHGSTWTPGAAIRQGRWKLIEFYEWGSAELYDLQADPGEQHDLSLRHAERLAELRRELARWQQSHGARMPQPNPAYVPSQR